MRRGILLYVLVSDYLWMDNGLVKLQKKYKMPAWLQFLDCIFSLEKNNIKDFEAVI